MMNKIEKLLDEFTDDHRSELNRLSVGYGVRNIKDLDAGLPPGILVYFFDEKAMKKTKLPKTYKGYPVYVKFLPQVPKAL